jgi:integrase
MKQVMATLQKRPNGFYLVYRATSFANGGRATRQVWTNIHTRDEREAKAALKKFRSEHRDVPANFTDTRFIDLMIWFRSMKVGNALSYEKTYKYACTKLEEEFGDCFLSTITKTRLAQWEAKMRADGLGNSSVHKYMALLKHVFRLAMDHDKYEGKDPFRGYKIPIDSKPRGVILTPEEQKKLLLACWDPEKPLRERQKHSQALSPETLRDLVECCLAYGFRLGELIGVNQKTEGGYTKTSGLRVGDLDPKTHVLRFRRTKVKEKGRGVRATSVKVSARIATILQKHSQGKEVGDLVFTDRGNPIFTIQKAFNDAVKVAKLSLFDDEGTAVKKLQFRDLRPTAASNMLDFGLNETQISKILGHVDTRMVGQVYLRKIQDDTMLKAADKIEQGMKERLGA